MTNGPRFYVSALCVWGRHSLDNLIKHNSRLALSMSYILDRLHHTSSSHHVLTVSSLLRLRRSLHECCEAPEAVLWPFTLMSLIRTSVPRDGSMLLLWRSWEGFLTVGALVLTLAPSLPSDSLRPFPEKEGTPCSPPWDPVQMRGRWT